MSRSRIRFFASCPMWRVAAISAIAFSTAGVALAQFDTASVLGFVRDTSGAVLANSTVSLVNTQTGQKVTVQTDAQGQFSFASVQVGSYQVDATANGFEETITDPFSVNVNARQRVDVQLKVGSQAQTVTVSGAASQLQSETSDSGTIVPTVGVRELPLNGRAYADLAALAPGVRRNSLENQSVTSRDASFNVNGERSEFNNFLLDGLDNNSYGTSNQGFSNQTIPPSPDAINQFQVETNNYSAEFGRASGAVINVSINSGTNSLHGRVWEYNRNTDFNAQGPFVAPTNAATGKQAQPTLVRNQFGGALGGPILKDKLFFFADFEGLRQSQGSYVISTVPTANQRAGIMVDSKGNPVALHDPVLGTSYANGQIPMAAWTPLAQLVVAALPAPNINAFTNNYATIANSSLEDNKGDGRLDYVFSNKTTIFGRYSQHYADIVDLNPIPGAAGGTSGYNGNIHVYNKDIAAGVTHAFSSNQILDARLGFTWTQGGKTPYLSGTANSLEVQAGIPGLPTDPTTVRALSSENITNFTGLGGQSSSPQFQNPFTINPKVNYSFLEGRHDIKVGFEWLSLNTEIDDFNPVYGSESYNGAFSQYQSATATACPTATTCGTADSGAKQDVYLADFLFGARSTYQLNNFVIQNQHQMMSMAYVQDDFKVSPALTINAGLRYEYGTAPVVDGNRLSNFSFTSPTTGTLIQASNGSAFNRALVHNPSLDFAPRFGLSYQVNPKTLIRSAYGLSFDQFNREGGENLLAYNGPAVVSTTVSSQTPEQAYKGTGTPEATCTDQNYANCFRTVAQGYPTGFASTANYSTATSEVRYVPKNIPTGYVQTWHFDVQREVASNTVLTVSYVGSHGVHLWVLADQNQSNFNAPGGTLGVDARRPITGFTTVEVSLPDGFLSYNGLQTKLEHRFANGLYLLNSFTWSHAEDNAAGHLDTPNGDNSRINIRNPLYDRGLSAYNQQLNETLSVVYDLPFGHQRMFGAHTSSLVNYLLGDWQLTAINSASSGQPINLNYTASNTQTVSSLLVYRPNVTGKVVAPSSAHVKTNTSVTGYFNTANVSAPTGVNPFGNAQRNSVYGPDYNDLDMGLHKAFSLWNENSKLDIRGEAFNILNHVNYNAPAYNVSSSSFGSITSALPPRQLQVAAKIIF
ncbi:TonB-dependent receptor [Acidipila sp. EB88]|uniref:TonB-dependent receptor n=1 Tax=Acidipila sp. EB88 TaxID=2305226 RepID=UPI000F5F7A03|nr:TonB-dependent receptor [Acidipila sp. EB88]RRA47244.1 TonB-dependent receptor [Acidipila sp. EB88]